MKPVCLLLILTAFACPVFSQQLTPAIEWSKCPGGSGDDMASTDSKFKTIIHGRADLWVVKMIKQ